MKKKLSGSDINENLMKSGLLIEGISFKEIKGIFFSTYRFQGKVITHNLFEIYLKNFLDFKRI